MSKATDTYSPTGAFGLYGCHSTIGSRILSSSHLGLGNKCTVPIAIVGKHSSEKTGKHSSEKTFTDQYTSRK